MTLVLNLAYLQYVYGLTFGRISDAFDISPSVNERATTGRQQSMA